MARPLSQSLSDVRTVGIPRGLLCYRFGTLWRTFFEKLRLTVVVSGETDRAVVDAGTARSVGECCLASKVYLGHIESLIGACDAIFLPCYASANPRAGFCTKFQSLPDLAYSTFRDHKTRFISLLVEDASDERKTRKAYTELARSLGASRQEARNAWEAAARAQKERDDANAARQENALRLLAERQHARACGATDAEQQPLGILLAAHPYIAHDRYLSGAVIDALEEAGTQHSTDYVCTPFKHILGDFIEALEAGADVLAQFGGPCRLGYYGELQESTLRDMGYDFAMLNFSGGIEGGWIGWAKQCLRVVNPDIAVPHAIKQLLACGDMATKLDEARDFYLANAGFEHERGAFRRAWTSYTNGMRSATCDREINEAHRQGMASTIIDSWGNRCEKGEVKTAR